MTVRQPLDFNHHQPHHLLLPSRRPTSLLIGGEITAVPNTPPVPFPGNPALGRPVVVPILVVVVVVVVVAL